MTRGRIPSLTPREVLRVLERAGFLIVRQSGSHIILRHPQTGNSVPIPIHRRDMSRGTLIGIIRESGLTRDEFLQLLSRSL